MGDEFDDDFSTYEWLSPPVRRDVTEHPVLDLVPFASARWVVGAKE
jgi:hypothetical protein